MVEVQERALGTLEEDVVAAPQGVLDEPRDVGEVRRETAPPGEALLDEGLDVLSVPTVYTEPKGMFLLEAMAVGVPVVQPRKGAFPEIVAKTGGGLIVERTLIERSSGGGPVAAVPTPIPTPAPTTGCVSTRPRAACMSPQRCCEEPVASESMLVMVVSR